MKPNLKVILPFVVLLAGGLIVAVMIRTRPEVKPAPREVTVPLVRAVALAPRAHQFKVHAQGSVSPHVDIHLTAEVAGRVLAVAPSFAAGGFFGEGEALVTIDPRDYELAVTRSRAQLAEAEVRLVREQAEADVALKEWESLGEGEASPLLKREPQLAEARAAVESARAAVQQSELDLARCRITAPFAGRVWTKKADIGQYVRKGDEVARIYSVDFAEVRLPLPLDEVGYLDLPMVFHGEAGERQGPAVTLRARFGTETHEWQGRVVRTEGEIDPKTRMLTAVVRVDNPYGRDSDRKRPPLAVGLFVDAEIQGRPAGEVLVVPRAAMRGNDRLLIVDRESRLRLRGVNVIRFEPGRVILRDGLREGDLVCVSPLDAPVDGMKVRLVESDEQPGAVAVSADSERNTQP